MEGGFHGESASAGRRRLAVPDGAERYPGYRHQSGQSLRHCRRRSPLYSGTRGRPSTYPACSVRARILQNVEPELLRRRSLCVYIAGLQPCGMASSSRSRKRRADPVVRFFSAVNGGAGIWGRGGASVGFDGFIYGATGDAPFDPAADEFGDTVLRLTPRTLQVAGYYTPSIWQYITRRDLDMGTSTPVIFRWGNRVLTAVGGKEGAIYVTDTAAMSGPDHHQAAYISPRYTNASQTFEGQGIWGGMTAWKDAAGQTWLYVPSWGVPTEAAKFPASYGPVTAGGAHGLQRGRRFVRKADPEASLDFIRYRSAGSRSYCGRGALRARHGREHATGNRGRHLSVT